MAEETGKTSTTTNSVATPSGIAPVPTPPVTAAITPAQPPAQVQVQAQTQTTGGRGKANAAGQTMAAARKMENMGGREYKYFTEISQMMFVFGEVQDPMPETVNLVEDIVRSQIIELVSVRVLNCR